MARRRGSQKQLAVSQIFWSRFGKRYIEIMLYLAIVSEFSRIS